MASFGSLFFSLNNVWNDDVLDKTHRFI
jgi:hypothetical protein